MLLFLLIPPECAKKRLYSLALKIFLHTQERLHAIYQIYQNILLYLVVTHKGRSNFVGLYVNDSKSGA